MKSIITNLFNGLMRELVMLPINLVLCLIYGYLLSYFWKLLVPRLFPRAAEESYIASEIHITDSVLIFIYIYVLVSGYKLFSEDAQARRINRRWTTASHYATGSN